MSQLLENSDSVEIPDDCHETDLLNAYKQSINIGKSQQNTTSLKSDKMNYAKSNVQLFKTNTETEKLTTFVIGTPCRAIYNEDGIEYEATITENVDEQHVIVQFFGYGNTQKVKKSNLKKSHGLQARMKQYQESVGYNMNNNENEVDNNDSSFKRRLEDAEKSSKYMKMSTASLPNFHECAFPPPPPFPPKMAMNMSYEEYESLNAMLMATYMKGFYTGYYQYIQSKK